MKYFKRLAAAVLSLGMLAGCRKTVPEQASSAGLSVIETELPVATEVPEETETPEIKETPEETVQPAETKEPDAQAYGIDEDGIYDTKDEVVLYLYTYHHLPSNYMTKKEARKLGWEGGALNKTVKGKCIGGDVFKDYDDNLPDIKGKYYECDIDTINRRSRGAKRLVWTDSYDIFYYTDDHYKTFEIWTDGEWQ